MKKLYLYLTMPLCILAASCSSDNASEPNAEEGSFNIQLSVLPTRAEGSDAQVKNVDEYAFEASRIHFGAYSSTGKLKHFLYAGGTLNDEVNAVYYEANWGHTVSARLPKSTCKDGFAMAFYSVPNGMTGNDSFAMNDLDNNDFRLLTWPGSAANKNVWPDPASNAKHHIPMAGLCNITAAYMKDYNPNVYTGITSFRLPDIQPERAMAKVVIGDPEGVIGSVTLKTPDRGYLSPEHTAWIAGGIVPPAVPDGMKIIDQTLDAPNGTVKDDNGAEIPAFIFYTFEQSFEGTKGDDPARQIISVVAATLTDKNGNPATTTLSIAPYDMGYPDGSLTAEQLMTKDNGAWQGVMRNRVYIYNLSAPRDMGLEVSVRLEGWDYEAIRPEI
ncbi:MAG: hypothetical protein K2J48_04140 [Muribaculaceae bacterium]|nr:hypothetical protein [Muribaculaceae bacterium]